MRPSFDDLAELAGRVQLRPVVQVQQGIGYLTPARKSWRIFCLTLSKVSVIRYVLYVLWPAGSGPSESPAVQCYNPGNRVNACWVLYARGFYHRDHGTA